MKIEQTPFMDEDDMIWSKDIEKPLNGPPGEIVFWAAVPKV